MYRPVSPEHVIAFMLALALWAYDAVRAPAEWRAPFRAVYLPCAWLSFALGKLAMLVGGFVATSVEAVRAYEWWRTRRTWKRIMVIARKRTGHPRRRTVPPSQRHLF